MALTLYHVEWCPDCKAVRNKLAELGVPYTGVIVPDIRPMRKIVHEVSGQYYVPVLIDGDSVLTETHDILAHLDSHYAKTSS
ncbi:MAG: glutathione S-transferase N-terminal domain-containing protein [Nitrospira sp.]|nr:glutathione S-transferase N-terminal domain-containing protein [Nitrospira sp.]